MRLFPKVEEWVLNELIDPNTNNVTKNLDFIYKILVKECEIYDDYKYDDLLSDFNYFLISPELEEDDDEDYLDSYKNIKTIIISGNDYLKQSYLSDIVTSYYDICALLLILKKIKEEQLTSINDPRNFIQNIDLDNFCLTPDLGDCSVTDFLSYDNILDDEFMIEFYSFQVANDITIDKLLSGGKYSYLFLNEKYKKLTYESYNQDSVIQLDNDIVNNFEFKSDLFKYNSEVLSTKEE